MKKLVSVCAGVVLLLAISSCNFISNSSKFNDTNKEFIAKLLHGKYDDALKDLDLSNETYKDQSRDVTRDKVANFGKLLEENFGKNAQTQFLSAVKTKSTKEGESTEPNTTRVQLEIYDDEKFLVIQFTNNDVTGKIIGVTTIGGLKKKPGMFTFWLGLIPALVVWGILIYAIVQVKRSNIRRKWLKYLMILVLNYPVIVFSALGIQLNFSRFQIIGAGFTVFGFSGSVFEVGLPLGALYVLWKLKNGLYRTNDPESVIEAQNQDADKDVTAETEENNEEHQRFMPKQD
jgi:hypothetical protein